MTKNNCWKGLAIVGVWAGAAAIAFFNHDVAGGAIFGAAATSVLLGMFG